MKNYPGCAHVQGPPIAQHPMPSALTSKLLLPNLRFSIFLILGMEMKF